MPDVSSFAPGTPSWVDLASPDLDASAAFYGAILGWDTFSPGPADQTGGYRMFTLDGKVVAGLGPIMNPEQPPAWLTYIATADADATAAKATEAGGQVLFGPMDVMSAGRMAVLTDPAGAAVGIWQAGDRTGAMVVNEPGALAWNELVTRDPATAKRFYTTVFDWGAAGAEFAGAPDGYTEWTVDGQMVGGMLPMGDDFPPEVPSHWAAYFAVKDCDAAVEQTVALGGKVGMGPVDIAPGRFAVCHDPHGAVFAVIALTPQDA